MASAQVRGIDTPIIEAHGTGMEVFADGVCIREKGKTTEFLFWRLYDDQQAVEVARVVMLREDGKH